MPSQSGKPASRLDRLKKAARASGVGQAAKSSGLGMTEARVRALVDRELKKERGRVDLALGALRASADDLRASVGGIEEREAERRNQDFTVEVLIGGRPGANRTLEHDEWHELGAQLSGLSGVEDLRHQMAQEYIGLLDAESRGIGRIAGTPYNIVGKLLLPGLLDLPDGDVLEIGALYGLFSPTLMRSFRRRGQFRNLTIVDPLVGQQLQGGKPIINDASGSPVVREVVERNFRDLGLYEGEARIVAGYSTDDEVKATVGDRQYAVVIVDGDHYEEGVLKDLWWVETILAPGGVAVLDDFGDKKWPGVEKAVERYLADGGKLTFLGAASTSGYLRMPEPSPVDADPLPDGAAEV